MLQMSYPQTCRDSMSLSVEVREVFWNVIIVCGAALAQFLNAYLGWRVTVSPTRLNGVKRKLYEFLFICCGVIGVGLIGLATYRASRERAHLWVSRVWPTYQPTNFHQGDILDLPSELLVNSPLAMNFDVKNIGKSSAINIQDWSHAYIRGDESLTSQEDVIESFKKWIATNPPKGGISLPTGETFWLTASGENLSPEDKENILS